MQMTKNIKPAAVSAKSVVAPVFSAGCTKSGGLPTIKEMMKPLVQPFGLIKSRQAGLR
jgi:hypothetical protein